MATSPNFHVPSKLQNRKLEVFNDRDADIFESGLAVRPENPHFVLRSTGRKVSRYIPKAIVDCYQLKIPNNISLVDEQGKEWDVKISKVGQGRMVCSMAGLTRLYKANLVGTGDACICEFMQRHIGLYIHVRIIRANELRGHDIFESGLAVEPENPYFVWRSTHPEKMKKKLHIPQNLVHRYNLKVGNCLTLVDERGNKWETNFVSLGRRLGCSHTGWRKLCDTNAIRTGDRCICEFIQESSGLVMHVRVVRDQAYMPIRKKGAEEEAAKQVDEESAYENGHDENAQDGNWMQRNTVEVKHKLNSAPVRRSLRKRNKSGGNKGFEEENCAETDKEILCFNLPNHNGFDENDGEVSGTEMNISKGKRKLRSPSSHAPVRLRSARKNNTLDRKKVTEEEKIKQIDEEILDLDPPEESRWKTEDAQQRAIENRKDDTLQVTSIGSSECLPEKLEMLQSYFQHAGEKAAIPITLHNDVFGKNYKICIFVEIVKKFCLLEPIADCCIISYMWYLHRKMKTENLLHRFQFVNPNYLSHKLTGEERARALADRLIGASTDQLVLAPCNVGFHWILTVIEPYKKNVFLLDPLSHRIRDETWRDAVNKALSMFSASKGDKREKLSRWVIVKAHLQPDSKQCGFYIMRYMKQIIEACRDPGSISLQSMFTKDAYSTSEIDEMRIEWAECILDHIG